MRTRNALFVTMTIAVLACWGCETEPVEAGDPPVLTQQPMISDCGGFEVEVVDSYSGDYCAAERLSWTYDAATETLELLDSRALLNCCGEHSIEIQLVDGEYVIRETDAPDGGGGRCDCMCVFDFSLSVAGIPAGNLPIRVERHVTDEGAAPVVLHRGALDLAAGSGEVVLSDESAELWCEGPTEEVSYSDEVSDCGGFPEPEEYDSGDYCDAQVLGWAFDAAEGTLALTDSRVLLNCCGDHSMGIELVDGVYVITETDAPDGGGGRCDCLCVFDYAMTVDGLAAGTIAVRLVLDVTDGGGAVVAWEGDLDLSAGAGEVVVSDEDAGMWCGAH